MGWQLCLMLFLLLAPRPAMAADRCLQRQLKIINRPIQKQAPWGNGQFTPPQFHDDENFLYLVHALQTDHASQTRALNIGMTYDPQKSLLHHPEFLHKKGFISTSVIEPGHETTFSFGGYILQADEKAVIATYTSDMGTPHISRPDLKLEDFLAGKHNFNQPKLDPKSLA